jgi:ElaB/YqjD/DUF883 family membrane-anchored ribosome-binding protein
MASTQSTKGTTAEDGISLAHDIETQIAQLREDISTLAKAVAGIGNGAADDMKSRLNGAADDMKSRLHDVKDEAVVASHAAVKAVRGELETAQKVVTDQVRERPLQSLGIAVAAGALLVFLARR